MTIVTFSAAISCRFAKSSGAQTITFEANRPYLLANAQTDRLMLDKNISERAYKVSRAETRIANAHVAAFKRGQRLLVYNGGGGFGDQIMTWPVARYLSRLGLDVHVLADPGNNICYWGLDFIKTVQTVPILWEQVKMFDHFALWETPTNMDEHQDQEHPVDAMFRKIGIDPASVPDTEKSVRPVFTPDELGVLHKYLQNGRKIGIYQLASANPVRCLPPNDSVFLLLKLAEAQPDIHWLCLYDSFVPPEYKTILETESAKRSLTNVEAFFSPNLRELWALTEHVNIVVSPDSMMAHIAGTFGTPCVGLWGPMSPDSRMKYYKNHHPIWHRDYCPHSPCFVYTNVYPRYCPPRPAARNVCDVVGGISPSEVIALVEKVKR